MKLQHEAVLKGVGYLKIATKKMHYQKAYSEVLLNKAHAESTIPVNGKVTLSKLKRKPFTGNLCKDIVLSAVIKPEVKFVTHINKFFSLDGFFSDHLSLR